MKNYFKDQKWNNYADIMFRNTHLWEGGAPSNHFLCLKARGSQGASTSGLSSQFTQDRWWRGSIHGFDVAELSPHWIAWPLIPACSPVDSGTLQPSRAHAYLAASHLCGRGDRGCHRRGQRGTGNNGGHQWRLCGCAGLAAAHLPTRGRGRA